MVQMSLSPAKKTANRMLQPMQGVAARPLSGVAQDNCVQATLIRLHEKIK
jgi:hypothetical protein